GLPAAVHLRRGADGLPALALRGHPGNDSARATIALARRIAVADGRWSRLAVRAVRPSGPAVPPAEPPGSRSGRLEWPSFLASVRRRPVSQPDRAHRAAPGRAARERSEPDPPDVPALSRPDLDDSVVGARVGKEAGAGGRGRVAGPTLSPLYCSLSHSASRVSIWSRTRRNT